MPAKVNPKSATRILLVISPLEAVSDCKSIGYILVAFILVDSHGLIISKVVLILVPLVLNVGAESETAVPSAALVRFVVVVLSLIVFFISKKNYVYPTIFSAISMAILVNYF